LADRVIIVGVTRHGEAIPIGDLKQMGGRCGRGHETGDCSVDIVAEECSAGDVEDGIVGANPEVKSIFGNSDLTAFHLLPEICSGNVFDEVSFGEWAARSFFVFDNGRFSWARVLDSLMESEAVVEVAGRIMPTNLGKIASAFYFHSADVCAWKENFSEVFRLGLENDDVAVVWALGNVSFHRKSGDFGKHRVVMEQYRDNLPVGLEIQKGCLVTATLWWHVFGGPSVGIMRNQSIELKDDFGRIHRVLVELDRKDTHWDMIDFFDELLSRSRRAISSELSSLFKIAGMTKGKATALYEMGIKTVDEIRQARESLDLEDIMGGGCEIP